MAGWYPLDETNGASARNLGSLPNADATLSGTTPVAGKVAGALDFQASGLLTVNSSKAYDFGASAFTLEAWIKGSAGLSTGVQSIVGKHGAGFVPGYILLLNQGRLGFHMHDPGGPRDVVAAPGAHSSVSDGNWHHVAVTLKRSRFGGTLYFDGAAVLTFDPNPGSYASPDPLKIAPGQNLQAQVDELGIFDHELTPQEIGAIFAAGSLGRCKPAPGVEITVDTNPAHLAVTVTGGPNNNVLLTAPVTYTAQPGSSVTHSTASTQIAAGTRYDFVNWTPSPPPNVASSPSQILAVPATAARFTANFSIAGYVVTVVNNNCTSVVTSANGSPLSTNPLVFAPGVVLTVNVTPTAGYVVGSIVFAMPGADTQTFPESPSTALTPLNAPATITSTCVLGMSTRVTVKTNPQLSPEGLKIQVLGAGAAGTYVNTKTYVALIGAAGYSHSVEPIQYANGTQYTFQNWQPTSNGMPTSPFQEIGVMPATPATYTANFNPTGYRVTIVNHGCTSSISSSLPPVLTDPLYYSAGTGLTVDVTALPGFQVDSVTVTPDLGGTSQRYPTATPVIPTLSQPITVTTLCISNTPTITHTILTDPPQLSVSVDGAAAKSAPFTVDWSVGTAHTFSVPTPQVNSTGDTQYALLSWTPVGPVINPAPAVPTTYTANFRSIAFKLTTIVQAVGGGASPGCSVSLSPAVPSSGFYLSGTVVTVTVQATFGWTFANFSGDATGAANPMQVAMNAPKRINVFCSHP
jgi:hypothetical protein